MASPADNRRSKKISEVHKLFSTFHPEQFLNILTLELTGRYAKFFFGQVIKGKHSQNWNRLWSQLQSSTFEMLTSLSEFWQTKLTMQPVGFFFILHRDDDEDWHPITFNSRRLRPEGRNYHAADLETLPEMHSLREWSARKLNFQAVWTSYGQSGCNLFEDKNWTRRWLDFVASFEVTIIHCSGKDNLGGGGVCFVKKSRPG